MALSFSPYGHLLHAVRKDHVEINNKLSTVEENSKVSYPISKLVFFISIHEIYVYLSSYAVLLPKECWFIH